MYDYFFYFFILNSSRRVWCSTWWTSIWARIFPMSIIWQGMSVSSCKTAMPPSHIPDLCCRMSLRLPVSIVSQQHHCQRYDIFCHFTSSSSTEHHCLLHTAGFGRFHSRCWRIGFHLHIDGLLCEGSQYARGTKKTTLEDLLSTTISCAMEMGSQFQGYGWFATKCQIRTLAATTGYIRWHTITYNISQYPLLNWKIFSIHLQGHRKLRAFITHGGLLSMFETVYHGTPVVTMPVFCDHDSNSAKAEVDGYALKLYLETLTSEKLLHAIHKVIHDPKYRSEAK